ncbi:TRAP transporter substrate-binding protein DctP [Vreelandella glaciei]|uniref:TRAP transporter substrate-binding protein DctP n=1 Tax=Vreelandella glaciei TaxID=186761 RepID=UPI003002A8D3
MSYNSKKFFGGIAISLTAMGALSSQALAQQSWTMTSTWPDSISLVEIDRRWAETVNKLVGDELQINFRAGGTLMPSTEVFDAIETGGIEAAGDSPVYWAGNSPAFSLLGTTLSLFTAVDYLNWIQERGGFELYQEVYGQYGMVYLPHGVVNNEAGFMGRTEIKSLADLDGKRLRISGRDQGRVLEQLGGSQVTLAGGEVYQAIERGVVDAAEFSTPGVNYSAGFEEVVEHWAVPGWHQSASVVGVMINKQAWNALSEETQEILKIAAESNLAWSLSRSEMESTEATAKFLESGVTINRYSDEDLEKIQNVANEVFLRGACEDPSYAKVIHSMIKYVDEYAVWRDVSVPFNMSRVNNNLPSLEEIESCMDQ